MSCESLFAKRLERPFGVFAFVALIIGFLVLTGCGNAQEDASSSTSADIIQVKAVDFTSNFIGQEDAMAMYETADGIVVYDLGMDSEAIDNGEEFVYEGGADVGLGYILEHGYPFVTFKNNKGMDAYITQTAIWWYLSEDQLSSDFKNADDEYGIVASAEKLVNAARAAQKDDLKHSSAAKIYVARDSDAKVAGLF